MGVLPSLGMISTAARRPRTLSLMLARRAVWIQPQFAESLGKRECIYFAFFT